LPQKEGMVDTNVIGEHTLYLGADCAADDCGN